MVNKNARNREKLFSSCPLCGEDESQIDNRLEDHIAGHLRSLALKSLPSYRDHLLNDVESGKDSSTAASRPQRRSTVKGLGFDEGIFDIRTEFFWDRWNPPPTETNPTNFLGDTPLEDSRMTDWNFNQFKHWKLSESLEDNPILRSMLQQKKDKETAIDSREKSIPYHLVDQEVDELSEESRHKAFKRDAISSPLFSRRPISMHDNAQSPRASTPAIITAKASDLPFNPAVVQLFSSTQGKLPEIQLDNTHALSPLPDELERGVINDGKRVADKEHSNTMIALTKSTERTDPTLVFKSSTGSGLLVPLYGRDDELRKQQYTSHVTDRCVQPSSGFWHDVKNNEDAPKVWIQPRHGGDYISASSLVDTGNRTGHHLVGWSMICELGYEEKHRDRSYIFTMNVPGHKVETLGSIKLRIAVQVQSDQQLEYREELFHVFDDHHFDVPLLIFSPTGNAGSGQNQKVLLMIALDKKKETEGALPTPFSSHNPFPIYLLSRYVY